MIKGLINSIKGLKTSHATHEKVLVCLAATFPINWHILPTSCIWALALVVVILKIKILMNYKEQLLTLKNYVTSNKWKFFKLYFFGILLTALVIYATMFDILIDPIYADYTQWVEARRAAKEIEKKRINMEKLEKDEFVKKIYEKYIKDDSRWGPKPPKKK